MRKTHTANSKSIANGTVLMKINCDRVYYGKMGLPDWVKSTFGWILQTVLRPVGVKGFVILPKRWIVERTFAWITKYRRNSKDYERNPESSKAMIYIAMTNRMLNYLQYRKIDV